MLAILAAAILAATMPVAMAGPATPTIEKRAAPTVPIGDYILSCSKGAFSASLYLLVLPRWFSRVHLPGTQALVSCAVSTSRCADLGSHGLS